MSFTPSCNCEGSLIRTSSVFSNVFKTLSAKTPKHQTWFLIRFQSFFPGLKSSCCVCSLISLALINESLTRASPFFSRGCVAKESNEAGRERILLLPPGLSGSGGDLWRDAADEAAMGHAVPCVGGKVKRVKPRMSRNLFAHALSTPLGHAFNVCVRTSYAEFCDSVSSPCSL